MEGAKPPDCQTQAGEVQTSKEPTASQTTHSKTRSRFLGAVSLAIMKAAIKKPSGKENKGNGDAGAQGGPCLPNQALEQSEVTKDTGTEVPTEAKPEEPGEDIRPTQESQNREGPPSTTAQTKDEIQMQEIETVVYSDRTNVWHYARSQLVFTALPANISLDYYLLICIKPSLGGSRLMMVVWW